MSQLAYLIPHRRTAPPWSAELEPIDLELEAGVTLPLLGTIAAGLPIEAIEDHETVKVPSQMARKASYALRVRGHSMTDDHIQDGDIIIVEQRQSAENGETVVAKINGDQVTLKRFYIEADGIRLQPAHPDMAPIILRHEELEILGIVTGVMRLAA
ncbi:transcriptional repressor LexA [Thiorhodovibrio frisius]|uniref:SOS regulatory protein LexA n=1 Tax=Thiorhodovibrio frisius TaxID=631362 RepID=H8YVN8_9GAMM|nr:transcriptional repressor LexA [Thiorhodovibrio frisius]EIC23978.1 SOS regulatory protein LexA [Thiorhodovibrio frisius]WPL23051.1 LexA repressor [Thiorhodovibrio frisius]